MCRWERVERECVATASTADPDLRHAHVSRSLLNVVGLFHGDLFSLAGLFWHSYLSPSCAHAREAYRDSDGEDSGNSGLPHRELCRGVR